jgi:hypothetical protein
MLFEGIEVPAAVKQSKAIRQASGRDDDVNGSANGHTPCAKLAKVSRSLDGQILTAKVRLFQAGEHAPRFVETSVVLESA